MHKRFRRRSDPGVVMQPGKTRMQQLDRTDESELNLRCDIISCLLY